MDIAQAKAIFSIDRELTKPELTKMYRKLSIKVHPDHNQNDPESSRKFQDLSEAYTVLCSAVSKPEERLTTLDAMVANLRPERLEMPPAIVVFHPLTLEQAYEGMLCPLELTRWVDRGGRRETELETIYVETRPGIDNGEVIILTEKGNRREDGKCGDVKVFVKIKPHSRFVRDGLTLKYSHSINLLEAYEGFTFAIQHLDGKEYKFRVSKVPIQPGSVTRIPDLGMVRDDYVGWLEISIELVLEAKPTGFVESIKKWFIGEDRSKVA